MYLIGTLSQKKESDAVYCFIIECFIEKDNCLQVNVWPYYNAEKQFDAPFTSIEDQHDFFKRKVSVLNDISKLSFFLNK